MNGVQQRWCGFDCCDVKRFQIDEIQIELLVSWCALENQLNTIIALVALVGRGRVSDAMFNKYAT